MTIWLVLSGVLLSIAASSGAYIYGLGVGEAKVLSRQSSQDALIREVIDASSQAAASEIAKIKVRHVTIKQQLQKELQERTIYKDCRTGSDAVRLFNSTIPSETAASQPSSGSSLPSAGAD